MLKGRFIKFLLLTVTGFLLLLSLHPGAKARASAAWRVLYNGAPSEIALMDTETGKVVPVSFQVPPEGQRHQYTVWVESDKAGQQVKLNLLKKEAPVRGPGQCRWCSGSRRCQDCYPAGSKVNTAGLPCIACNASGACQFCHGNGVCWTCDGRGFDTGCPDCGKAVAKK